MTTPADSAVAVTPPEAVPALAPRWRRLVAIMIDTAISLALITPLMIHFDIPAMSRAGIPIPTQLILLLSAYSIATFLLVNGYLLHAAGQTVGKWALRIAIVDMKFQRKSLSYLVAWRYLPIWVAAYLPGVGAVLSLIDVAFIFGKSRRCLHDRIAGTQVVGVARHRG